VATEEYFGHFTKQALEVGVVGMETENLHLRLTIEEEAFEAKVMYRDFQAQAEDGRRPRRRRAVPAPARGRTAQP
jgi:hypothetical protein